jgi:hypothetical protein
MSANSGPGIGRTSPRQCRIAERTRFALAELQARTGALTQRLDCDSNGLTGLKAVADSAIVKAERMMNFARRRRPA